MKRLLPAALGILVGISCEPQRPDPPQPTRWVTDNAGLLSAGRRGALDAKLEAYQERTGHSVLVWIGDTTGGEPHADWCTRMFNRWAVGRHGEDDGVVLFIFPKDRMRWITTGWGMEKALPDKECSRICRTIVKPSMESGNPDDGVTAGVDAMLTAIDRWEASAKP